MKRRLFIGIVRLADGSMIRFEVMVRNDNYQQQEKTRSTPHLKVQPTNPPTNTQNAH
ncbi:hypothetical protein [Oscillatoria nigro-viridis]|uniref:hypothetical protein n=1 Tax=Phormidium nigroviride TaxID=482564 RepID=UPI00167F657D|nr:hypothetical protein [Oscillatoria nigro-viridis]